MITYSQSSEWMVTLPEVEQDIVLGLDPISVSVRIGVSVIVSWISLEDFHQPCSVSFQGCNIPKIVKFYPPKQLARLYLLNWWQI